jgi:hypothetical protein
MHAVRRDSPLASQARSEWAIGAAIVVTGIVVAGLSRDLPLGLLFGIEILLVSFVRRTFGRTDVSFADGFLPRGSEMALPPGVQEDDDFRWNWEPRRDGSERGRR